MKMEATIWDLGFKGLGLGVGVKRLGFGFLI